MIILKPIISRIIGNLIYLMLKYDNLIIYYILAIMGEYGKKIVRAHVRSIPVNMPVKFEVRSFDLFGVIGI